MVGPGVRRRYGDRAGDAYQWLERRFNRATRGGSLARRYLNETRSLAERLHVTYLDLPQGTLQETDAFFLPDSTHITTAAHRAIAEVIMSVFKDGRISARSD